VDDPEKFMERKALDGLDERSRPPGSGLGGRRSRL